MDSPEIPPAVWALMAECGPKWGQNIEPNVRRMIDAFGPVLKNAPKQSIEVRRDISYGPHPLQVFDLYLPPATGKLRPALFFAHGGAFVDGKRNRSDEIYANVMFYVARYGTVGVNIGYRLAPEARYPEATRDVGAVVGWLRVHAHELSIDPNRLFLMGHSAGAAHAASYAYDRRLHPAEGPGLAGLVVVSGRVRADNLPENPNARKVAQYYGEDAGKYDNFSPVSHVDGSSIPTLVAWAEFENPLLDVYCAELVHRLAVAKRRGPPVVWLKRHNHTSIIAHINTATDTLGAAIRDFIANPR